MDEIELFKKYLRDKRAYIGNSTTLKYSEDLIEWYSERYKMLGAKGFIKRFVSFKDIILKCEFYKKLDNLIDE